MPLSDFYASGAELVKQLGGTVEQRTGVDKISQQPGGGWEVRCGERRFYAENLILAAPFEQTQRLLNGLTLEDKRLRQSLEDVLAKTRRFVHAPFISVLLWYDRQITDLHHAWLLDATIQWFFHKSKIRSYAPELGSHVELVIAGSRRELAMSRAEILQIALRELERFFPAVRDAALLKSGILKEAQSDLFCNSGA